MCLFGKAGISAFEFEHLTTQEQPRPGGELVFVVAAEPPSFDAHREETFGMLHPGAPHYNTLLRVDPTDKTGTKFIGDLAESWTVSPDKRTEFFAQWAQRVGRDNSVTGVVMVISIVILFFATILVFVLVSSAGDPLALLRANPHTPHAVYVSREKLEQIARDKAEGDHETFFPWTCVRPDDRRLLP